MYTCNDSFWWLPGAPTKVQVLFKDLAGKRMSLKTWLRLNGQQAKAVLQDCVCPTSGPSRWYCEMIHNLTVFTFRTATEEDDDIVRCLVQFLPTAQQRTLLDRGYLLYTSHDLLEMQPGEFCIFLENVCHLLRPMQSERELVQPPVLFFEHYGCLLAEIIHRQDVYSSDKQRCAVLAKALWNTWPDLISEHVPIFKNPLFLTDLRTYFEQYRAAIAAQRNVA